MQRLHLLSVVMALLAGCSSMTESNLPAPVRDGPSPMAGPGIHRGSSATFDARHAFTVTVPPEAHRVDVWFATPSPADPMQEIRDWRVECEHPCEFVTDRTGNRFLHVGLDHPAAGSFDVTTTFELVRYEAHADIEPSRTRPHTPAELEELSSYLKGSSQSVIDDDARAMAARAVGTESNPILASRRIYDAILNHVDYHVKDPRPDAEKVMKATGTGSSKLCYSTCTGNCTDFHSLYAAVSRAAGIPTRVVFGSFFKGPLDGADTDQSYHCWIEFHAPNIGWIPLDVAVADIFVADFVANENSRPRADLTVADGYHGPDPERVDFYFGNLDARRVSWHWGRDLVMNPPQSGPPLLWNPKAYAEVDGQPQSIVSRTLTFHQRQ
ncbi:MAG: transglutaminase domain-containing protein [Planctomycetes bacterium]|nr:transglutaminase domain-containing protein [Planctomycetota bacterium]